MRPSIRAVALATVAVLGLLLVGPQQLGGPAAAVSTFGDSMLPTYRPHHLVVVGSETNYEVGQVVAYRSDTLDTVVLHRIVDGDAGAWITQGDNNDWLDPDRPDTDDIIGRVWFAVPLLGRLLDQPALVRTLLPLAAIGGIMLATRPHRQPGRGRLATRSRRPSGEQSTVTAPAIWAGPPVQLGVAAVGVVVVGALLAVGAWSRPLTVPGTVEYSHGGEFSYEALVAPGPVYPDGRIDPGEPIFLRLADRVDVAFDWEFTSSGASDRLRGTGQLVAVVEDGSGWRTSLPVGPSTQWTGTHATLVGVLDFAEIHRLTSQVVESTGVSAASRTVTLTAETVVDGEVGGSPFSSRADSSLVLAVDDLRAQVVASEGDGTGGTPLTSDETGSVTAPGLEPAHLSLVGRDLSVAVARPTSIVLLALGLVLAAAAAVLALRTRSWDQHRRIEARHAGMIVPIDGLTISDDKSVVAVPSIDQLVELAHHRDLPVLRVPTQDGGMLYVADDASAQYRYIVHPARPAPSPNREGPGAPLHTQPSTQPPPPPPPRTGEGDMTPVAQHFSARRRAAG